MCGYAICVGRRSGDRADKAEVDEVHDSGRGGKRRTFRLCVVPRASFSLPLGKGLAGFFPDPMV